MSTENQVAPATETQTPVATAVEAVAEPNTTADVGQQPESTEKPEKTPEQKEIERLRRHQLKAERNNARLYQENLALKQPKPETEETTEVDPQKYREDVEKTARQLAKADRLNERCNGVVEKGRKEFPDFSDAVATVGSEMPLFERDGAPTAALDAILEADNPSALLHYLGKNPDIASELSDLSTAQLTRRLVRIEAEMAKPKPQSKAPAPLEPVKAQAAPATPDPATNPAAWREWRNKQEAAKRR